MCRARLFYVRKKFESALLLCIDNVEDTMRDAIIYKILRQAEWAQMQQDGSFAGSVHDTRDGFIHMSTAAQLQGTLDKHYTQGDVVILAAVRLADIEDSVKWEVSRGGAEFSAVKTHWALSPDSKGRYAPSEFIAD